MVINSLADGLGLDASLYPSPIHGGVFNSLDTCLSLMILYGVTKPCPNPPPQRGSLFACSQHFSAAFPKTFFLVGICAVKYLLVALSPFLHLGCTWHPEPRYLSFGTRMLG